MKRINFRTVAFTILTAGMLVSCSTENTTGVEAEGNVESQPNMGGKTGNTAGLDSIPTEEGDTTNENVIETQQ